jgi:hypothetical protein
VTDSSFISVLVYGFIDGLVQSDVQKGKNSASLDFATPTKGIAMGLTVTSSIHTLYSVENFPRMFIFYLKPLGNITASLRSLNCSPLVSGVKIVIIIRLLRRMVIGIDYFS